MNVRRVERVAAACALGESPVWSVREQVLYWVDLRAPSLQCYDPSAGTHRHWTMPALIGGVVIAADGRLLVALQSGIHRFAPASGALERIVSCEPASAGNRMNDTKSDRCGRLWTTTMRDFGAAPSGALYRIDADLTVTRLADNLRVPNSLAWSPDDSTLYFADTSDGHLRACDFDRDTGGIGPWRVLVEAGALPGRPDGATVDADGCVWSARYGGGAVVRITPDGRVDRVIRVPATQVAACAFGDADLRTLYITTARQRLSEDALASQPDAGALFAVRLDVTGLPEPACVL
jgi:sugar lactone lactonase YvrE